MSGAAAGAGRGTAVGFGTPSRGGAGGETAADFGTLTDFRAARGNGGAAIRLARRGELRPSGRPGSACGWLTVLAIPALVACGPRRGPSITRAPPAAAAPQDAPAAGIVADRRAPPPQAVAVIPLRCPSATACVDAAGTEYACQIRHHQTGRGKDLARTCRQLECGTPPCAAFPVLSGEVVNGDVPEFPRVPGAIVTVALPDLATQVATPCAGDGRFHVAVPADVLAHVRVDAPGWVSEWHAVQVPADGWDVPLDLRHFTALAAKFPPGPTQNPQLGMLVVEFLGLTDLRGIGVAVEPTGAPPFVFDAQWRAHPAPLLGAGDKELQFFGNLPPGEVKLRYLTPPGVTCRAQARSLAAWPVQPGMLTQVDAECQRQ